MKTAFVIVDLQNDFCPGGALAVKEGDQIIDGINQVIETREFEGTPIDVIVATMDWHPPDHKSFADNHPGKKVYDVIEVGGLPQVLWPRHCVQGTPGAQLHPRLLARFDHVTHKGMLPEIDSYSGFFDNGKQNATDLDAYLKGQGVTDVYVCALAADYCVGATAIDGADLGYKVHYIPRLSRGVELNPGDIQAKIAEMQAHGVRVVPSSHLPEVAALSKTKVEEVQISGLEQKTDEQDKPKK